MMRAKVVRPILLCRRACLKRREQSCGRQVPQLPSLRRESSQRGSQTGGPTLISTTAHLLQGQYARSKQLTRRCQIAMSDLLSLPVSDQSLPAHGVRD